MGSWRVILWSILRLRFVDGFMEGDSWERIVVSVTNRRHGSWRTCPEHGAIIYQRENVWHS